MTTKHPSVGLTFRFLSSFPTYDLIKHAERKIRDGYSNLLPVPGKTMKVQLVLAVVTLLGLPCTHSSLTGYDCSDTEVLNTVSTNDIFAPCKLTAARTIRGEIYEIKGPKTVVGYRCQIRYKQALVDWRGSKRLLPVGTVIIGRDACLQAHKFGYIDLEDRVPNLDPHGTTKHSLRTVYPDVKFNQAHYVPGYHDHYYERDYDITLSQHSGLVDFQENLVHFDNGIYCDYSNFSCIDGRFGEFSWTTDLQQKFSSSIFGGNITLITVNETLMTPKRTYAVMQVMLDLISFRVLHNVTVSGKVVFRTDHPDLYIEPITKFTLGWSHFRAPKLYEYVNLTKSYSSRHDAGIGRYDPISHLKIAERFCLKDNLDMINHCNSSSETFAVGCTIPLSKPGILGFTHFGSIVVKKCERHIVHGRETDKCYSTIPVRDESFQEKFLDPLSRVLVSDAQPIVCDKNKTNNINELFGNSTKKLRSSEKDSKKLKERSLPDWALLILIVFACVWGIFGAIKLAQLIIPIVRKRQYSVSCDDSPFSISSYWSNLKGKLPWRRREAVQEETELDVRFPG